MFDFSMAQIAIVAVAALVFIGPKELPGALRSVGKMVGKARGMANEFKRSFDDMARQSELEELRAAAATVRAAALKLRFEQLEFWDKPRVLCATGSKESEAAHDLARRLGEAAVAAGFAPDLKPFRAHLTLARKVKSAEAAKIEWPRPFSPSMTVRCDRFVLMQSRREDGGSIYSALDSWELDDDKSR